jgi:hypothetical protein
LEAKTERLLIDRQCKMKKGSMSYNKRGKGKEEIDKLKKL